MLFSNIKYLSRWCILCLFVNLQGCYDALKAEIETYSTPVIGVGITILVIEVSNFDQYTKPYPTCTKNNSTSTI